MKANCIRSKKILDKLKSEAKIIEFNDKSKIVLISDAHRGDGGYADSLRVNENIYKAALKFYYKNDYYLLELGDGDELWKNKNCLDIAYIYKDIFKLFEKFYNKKRLCLLYGNHDMIKSNSNFINKQKKACANVCEGFGDSMIKLYSNIKFYESAILRDIDIKQDIVAFHGHQVDFINCEAWKLSRFLVRYIWRTLEGVGGFKAPTSPAKNYGKGTEIDNILESLSRREKSMIICGHTHNDRLPKPGESLYINDGCCVFPSSITTIEITCGNISLIRWKIQVDNINKLFIEREVIGGPYRLIDYFKVENLGG